MPPDNFFVAKDPVAAAVEEHLRNMEDAGHGEFSVNHDRDEVVLVFRDIEVRGETYDIALLRLASAVLDSADLCFVFLACMRDPSRNPPAVMWHKNLLEITQAEDLLQR